MATVIDRGDNGADAANLEILGVGAAVSREAFRQLVVVPGIAFARAGTRRALHLPLNPGCARIDGAAQVLQEAGFALHHSVFTMRRPEIAAPPAAPDPLPDGWRWAPLEGGLVDAAHAALLQAFAGSASLTLSPLPLFRRGVASGATTWRALLDGEAIVGLVQIAAPDAGYALRTVARVPAYRGQGVGARLVGEALRLLRDRGARDVELSVEAANARALALYRRFGFEVASRTPVYALALRPIAG